MLTDNADNVEDILSDALQLIDENLAKESRTIDEERVQYGDLVLRVAPKVSIVRFLLYREKNYSSLLRMGSNLMCVCRKGKYAIKSSPDGRNFDWRNKKQQRISRH